MKRAVHSHMVRQMKIRQDLAASTLANFSLSGLQMRGYSTIPTDNKNTLFFDLSLTHSLYGFCTLFASSFWRLPPRIEREARKLQPQQENNHFSHINVGLGIDPQHHRNHHPVPLLFRCRPSSKCLTLEQLPHHAQAKKRKRRLTTL